MTYSSSLISDLIFLLPTACVPSVCTKSFPWRVKRPLSRFRSQTLSKKWLFLFVSARSLSRKIPWRFRFSYRPRGSRRGGNEFVDDASVVDCCCCYSYSVVSVCITRWCHFGGVMRPAVEGDLTLLVFGPCLRKRRSNLLLSLTVVVVSQLSRRRGF